MVRRRTILSTIAGLTSTTLAGCTTDSDPPSGTTENSNSARSGSPPSSTDTATAESTTEPTTTQPSDFDTSLSGYPMLKANAARTGVLSNQTGPQDNASIKWSFTTGGPVRSSPAVVDGTVYVGCDDGNLYAIETNGGNEKWVFETGGKVFSSPAVTDSAVYFGSYDGTIYAVSNTDGSELWSVDTGGRVYCSPVIADGTVFVAGDSTLYALDPRDGTEQWSVSTAGQVLAPTVANGSVVYGTYNVEGNQIHAVSPDDGSRQWRYQTPRAVDSTPVIANGRVFVVGRNGNLHVLSLTDGSEAWSTFVGGRSQSPVVMNETVYVGGNGFRALNVSDGSEQWVYEDFRTTVSSPVIADGTLYTGERNGQVRAFSPDDGSLMWSAEIGGVVESSPAVLDGTVYLGNNEATVYALE